MDVLPAQLPATPVGHTQTAESPKTDDLSSDRSDETKTSDGSEASDETIKPGGTQSGSAQQAMGGSGDHPPRTRVVWVECPMRRFFQNRPTGGDMTVAELEQRVAGGRGLWIWLELLRRDGPEFGWYSHAIMKRNEYVFSHYLDQYPNEQKIRGRGLPARLW